MRTIRRMTASAVVWLMFAVCAIAANYYPDANFRIYCEPVSMPYSGVVTVPLLLDNPQGYGDMRRAFQVDVTLPVGYEFVANNGSYSVPMAGCKIHEHLFNFDGSEKLRLLFTADEVVPATLGRQICTLTLKQTDRTLKQSSTISFTNFIYVRAASTSGHYGSEQTVTVNPYVYATAVTLNKTSLDMFYSDTYQLSASLTPSNSTSELTWISSNTTVATVDDNGLVTTHALGNATIKASTTDGTNVSASCLVTSGGITSFTIDKTSATINVDDELQLTTAVTPQIAGSYQVIWSSNNNVATVDGSGKVKAKRVGTAIITARSTATTSTGAVMTAQCVVTVKGATGITFDKTKLTMYTGETETIKASVTPVRYATMPLTWETDNESVAVVDEAGKITAVGLGTANVTATTTDGTNLSATCNVTVLGASGLTFDKTDLTMYYNETTVIKATITPERSAAIPLSWRSSNTSVATVNANGMVTALAMGSAKITATTTDGSNLSATCDVVVRGTESLTLNKSNLTMFQGDVTKLNATVSPTRAASKPLSWTSSSSSVATVDSNGNVAAKGIGTATITVATTDGAGLSAKCIVTVTPDYTLLVDTVTHVRGSARVARAVNISLANRNAISAMQFDLSLPSYMTMAYSDGYPDIWLDTERKARNHSVDISKTSSSYQQYRVIVSSPTNKTFSGNGGAVLHFNVLINQYPGSAGNYAIELSNIVLSEADETQHTISQVTGNVKYGYLVGDANADVKVDVSDYVLTANKILQRSVSDFWSDAANAAYNDNTINVTDLVAITNIALEIREKEIRPAPAVRTIDGEVPLSIAIAEQEATTGSAALGLSLSNKMALAALQADVTLPEGMSLVEAKSTGRAERYAVESAMLPDGRVRLVLSQFGNAAIAAGEGDIIMLTLAGKATGDATMRVDNITAAERNLTTHYVEGITAQLVGITGVADVTTMQPHIYIDDGAVAIDSPVAGMATVATIDGRNMTIEVQAGHNLYHVPSHGVYIIYLNGVVAKLAL